PDDRSLVIDAPRDRIEPIAQMAQTMDAQGVGVPLVRAYQFTEGSAAEAARALARLLAPAPGRRATPGEIAARFEADSATNQLLVSAPESSFQEIEALIEKLQKGAAVASQTKSYPLKFAKATEIVDVLQTMLTGAVRGRPGRAQGGQEVRLAAAGGINAILVQGPPDKHALAEELIKTLDREEMGAGAMVQIVRLKNAQADSLAKAVTSSLRTQQARGASPADQVTVTAETNSNSVLVRGPAADMPAVIEMIRKIDSDSDSGEVQVRIFPLQNSEATELAATVGRLFQDMIRQQQRTRRSAATPPFSVAADDRTNALVVSTTPAYFALVEGLLEKLDKEEDRPKRDILQVMLKTADSMDVADKLTSMYASLPKKEQPLIEPDIYTNSVTIIAKAELIKEIAPIIEKMDPEKTEIEHRVIPLTKVKADQMAEVIQRIYGQTHGKKIRIIDQRRPSGKTIEVEPGDLLFPSVLPGDETPPNPPPPFGAEKPAAEEPRKGGAASAPAKDDEGPGITITVDRAANALVVSGTRTELENIEYLIERLADSAATADAEFRSYRLKHAEAGSVAKTLDALFNPKPVKVPQQAAQKGRPAPAAPLPLPVISVVADPRTRTVIVRAKPVDFEMIEPLIQLLDKEAKSISEIRVFPLVNSNAVEVAANLRELFGLSRPGAAAPAAPAGKQATPQQRRAETVRRMIELRRADGVTQVDTTDLVSITANRQTNSVIATAPPGAMELIAKVIEELDQSAESTAVVVQMYPLQHAAVRNTVAALKELFAPPKRGAGAKAPTPAATEEPVVVTGDESSGLILVSATAEKHKLIRKTIEEIDLAAQVSGEVTVQVYKLEHADAAGAAGPILQTLSRDEDYRRRRTESKETLRVNAERSSNSLIVRATKLGHEKVQAILAKLDVPPPTEQHPVRVIPLNNVEAAEAARVLKAVFASGAPAGRGQTASPQKVVIEASRDSRMLMVRADPETYEKIRSLAGELDTRPAGLSAPSIIVLKNAQAATVASAVSQAFRTPRGVPTRPEDYVSVVAEPVSNSVLVTASETNLKKVQDLVAKLDEDAAGGRRTEFVVLKHAKAVDIAPILQGVAAGSSGPGTRDKPAQAGVTVSADAASNAVILSGPAADVDKLMQLVLQLDQAAETVAPVVKMYPVKNADIPTMVTALQQIFAQTQQRGRGRFTAGSQTPVTVIGDEGARKLIVSAPADKHEMIAQVIRDFDEAGEEAVTVQVYKIENVDATTMASAISEALGIGGRGVAGRGAKSTGGGLRISADRGSITLLVRASKEDHEKIARYVKEMDVAVASKYPVQTIPLNFADADNVARVLNRVFVAAQRGRGAAATKESVIIEADRDSRTLMVRADAETFAKVRELAAQLDTL
ncbi:MAG TPA: secretin N-terminal domain-containing protein, partial [Phycisphaerae bacterium]|nr:secretin N-terminal domain-containing protein [Phycisphaerae bacterium]